MGITWEDDPSVTVSMKDIKILIAEPGVLSKYHFCDWVATGRKM